MKKTLSCISLVLVFSLLANMLPFSILAENLQSSTTSSEAMAAQSVVDEIALEEAYVVVEITEKRTEYSKEFLLSNGLHMATVYADAVHYETASGWEEIDNTLKTNADGTYSNTAGVWDVTFPEQLGEDESITIEKDGYTLSFFMSGELTAGGATVMSVGLDDAPMQMFGVTDVQTAVGEIQQIGTAVMKQAADFPETVPDKLQSQIAYAEVYDNTDIVYDLDSNKVKESMILESYDADLQGYSYTLEVGTMVPVLGEDGSVILYDENQENIIMVMPAPYLIDDGGERNYDIQVHLEGHGSTYALIYLLPTDWLAAENRIWPVVLDPIIEADLDTSNIRDRTVSPKKTYAQTWGVNSCGYDTDSGIMRFYLKYNDLPALTSSDVVVSASVQMYKAFESSTITPVYVHKVNTVWDSSTITWTNKPDFDPTIEDYAIVDDIAWYSWEITDIARDWYAKENTGMLFKASNAVESGGAANFKQFLSSDYGTEASRPVLHICFRNNNGLENYWDYTTSSAGRAGTGYINNYTGNLTFIREDMGFGGNRMPVAIRHIYNANNSTDNRFLVGAGWRTNYHQLVYRWSEDSNYYVWEDADGTAHYFKFIDGQYQDEDGLELVLTDTGSGTEKYCITDKQGNRSFFDTYGRLTKQSNNQQTPSHITLTYTTTSGKGISTITDGAGRVYRFFYNSTGNLSYIAYRGTGNTNLHNTGYGYTDSRLTVVVNHDSKQTHYEYNGNGLLNKITDIDGYKLDYTYHAVPQPWQPYRVQSVAESDGDASGGTLTFAYAHNQTTITDYSGNVVIYQFNDYGNTISVQDDVGNALFAKYAINDSEESGKGNQLKLSSKLQNTVGNRYKDSSFEYQTAWTPHGSTVTTSASTETAYYGNYAQKIVNTAYAANNTAYSANFYVAAGETVTASAYIKNPDAVTTLELHYYDNDTSTYPYVASNTVAASSSWTRAEVTLTNPKATGIYVYIHLRVEYAGTYYVDCVQVENAATASRYNLVENGDFRNGEYGWTRGTYFQSTETCVTSTQAANQLGTTVYQITGDPGRGKHLWQRLNISGDADDTYVLAGWAKADSAPISTESGRRFALTAVFQNTDGSTTTRILSFNPDVGTENEWQYLSGPVIADKPYNALHINVQYDYNVNTAYFDGIQLYKETFGTSYTYDEDGNVRSVVDLQKQTTTYEYDANNNLTQIIQDGSAKMTYEYDNHHNVILATSDEGLEYEFEYDDYGNNILVSTTTDGKTMQSSAVYTSDGNRLVSTTDALGKTTTYSYNANTNVLEWVQYPEDTAATRTNYTYDSMYRMATAACTTDTGLSLNAAYTYEDDLLKSIQTPSTTYTFTYGDFALRTGVSIGDRTLATYKYTEETEDDRKFDLDRLDYGNGDKVQYEYDDEDRIIKQIYEDGDTVTYAYDNSGALARVTDSQSGITTTYFYDLTGRMMKYVESGTGYDHSVGYEYDTLNNLTGLVETINGTTTTTTYTYDEDNRLVSSTTGNVTLEYVYDDFGRVETKTTKNGTATVLTESYTYTAPTTTTTSSQIATYTTIANSGYTVTYSYTYDNNGNILSVCDGTNTTSYVYDSANQLIRENNQEKKYTYTWIYDNAGNLLSRSKYAYTTGSLETVNPTDIITYTYGDEEWGDLLTSYDGSNITYDAIGNPLTDGTWIYAWQHGRQLAAMTKGTTTWNYTYNADGIRTQRTNGTTTYSYVYDGSLLKEMTVGNNILSFTYDADGTPLTVTYNGVTYYYVTNLQGDVTMILSAAGKPMATYAYNAWGQLLTISGSMKGTLGILNPLRYRGYVYDQETGLYYVSSRYYDPEIGRWINADNQLSTGSDLTGMNLFAYCGNNPVNRIDPNGHAWKDIKNWFSNTQNTVKETALKVIETGRNFIDKINNYVNSFTQELSYKSNGPKKGAKIVDSYTLNDPVLMHKYIDENRGDNITGSTNGVVVEWVIHNVAYQAGQFFKVVGLEDIGEEFMTKGQTLDIGSTIYDDNHGLLSVMMWAFYAYVDPINAGRDALIEIFE